MPHPLFLAAALALSSQDPDLSVHGLRPGESAVELAAEPPDLEQRAASWRHGRVVDARTGRPIQGATIEAWTEETARLAGGFRRVGEATSGIDGGFRLRVRDGALEADKIRARADGYLAAPGVPADLELLRLVPRGGWMPLLRVADLEDRPIDGARVTTTYSCAHDLPAFEAATDATGLALLDAFGPQERTPELRVRAAGFGARKYLDLDELLPEPDGTPAVLRLPRRRPLRARLVDGGGQPIAGQVLHVVDGDGFHVLATGADGSFAVDSPYGGAEVTVYAFVGGEERHVYSGSLPDAFAPALRLALSDGEGEDEETAALRVELPARAEDAPPIPVHLFHASGWTDSASAKGAEPLELAVPAGELTVVAGGRFQGWREEIARVELAAGEERALRLDTAREPTLVVRTPPGEAHRLVVQAGDDSVELEPARDGETHVSVPGGETLVVLSEGDVLRRLALAPLGEAGGADLRGDARVVERPRALRIEEEPRKTFEVLAFDETGGQVEGELVVEGPLEATIERVDAGRFRVRAPAACPLLLTFRAPGRADSSRAVWTSALEERVALRPAALASLRIESERAVAVEGHAAGRLDALHPGPLRLVLRTEDGRRLGLALELAAGERRVLRVE